MHAWVQCIQAVTTCVGKYLQELEKQLRLAVDSRQLGVGAAGVSSPVVVPSRSTSGTSGSNITTTWQVSMPPSTFPLLWKDYSNALMQFRGWDVGFRPGICTFAGSVKI
jgi:hypothetical protein